MNVSQSSLISELYAYYDWANARLFQLCEGLSDEELDAPREIGYGSLRAILFHLLAAEQLWMDRWLGKPWQPLETDPCGISLQKLAEGFCSAAGERESLIDTESHSDFSRLVTYRNSQDQQFTHALADLLIHVANHAIHHRAQALNYLKQLGRTVPAGLDYLFFRLAYPTVDQPPETVSGLKAYGLEIDTAPGHVVQFEKPRLQRFFAYGDWANQQALAAADSLDNAALDRDFQMGLGGLRKTLLHIYDAERWWLANWQADTPVPFEHADLGTSLQQLKNWWATLIGQRNNFLRQLDAEHAERVVTVKPGGGPPTRFRVLDSLIQLCCHGTHHRAQTLNMLRRNAAAPPVLDYVAWVRMA